MFQKTLSLCGIPLAAAALVFVTSSTAEAQRGGRSGGFHSGGIHTGPIHSGPIHSGMRPGGFNPGFHNGGFHNRGFRSRTGNYLWGYGYPPYYSYPSYGGGSYSYDPYSYNPYPMDGSADVYNDVYPDAHVPPLSGETIVLPAVPPRAYVTVNVPADAQVWFDDQPTTSTGPVREFNTPPLMSGSQYSYEIKARWNENGHEVTQTHQVEFTAGQHLDVNFPVPPSAEQSPAAKSVE